MPEPAKQPIERNPSWTDTENEAIVADYLDMFREHVEGQRVRKKEHRLTLIENGLKRSEASIEFKHRNISAVLAGMGYPYLPGYRPAWNYQRPLLDMVEILKPSESFLAGAEAALRQGLILENEEIDPTDVFVKEPTTEPKQKEAREGLRRMLRKIDPATRDMRLREIGAAGEAFVLDVERARMVDFKRPDLVAEVKQVSLSDDGAGYDIRSFDHNGEERFIEVKTTPGAVASRGCAARGRPSRRSAPSRHHSSSRRTNSTYRDPPRDGHCIGSISFRTIGASWN